MVSFLALYDISNYSQYDQDLLAFILSHTASNVPPFKHLINFISPNYRINFMFREKDFFKK